MNCLWYILLAFFILNCGGNSTGPEIEPEPIPNHAEGDLIIDLPGGVKMAFIWVESGTFRVETLTTFSIMEIPKGFYLGKYELTQQQWEQVMHTTPWSGRADVDSIDPNFPAAYISESDAQAYVEKLTALQNDAIYRLPTGKEWEYASRASTITTWFFGDSSDALSDYAWWSKNVNRAQIVGTKLPNPWGFYDMYGNVAEWTQDGFDTFIGPLRYIVGGSYNATSVFQVSSIGIALFPGDLRHPDRGVRILREGPKVSQP